MRLRSRQTRFLAVAAIVGVGIPLAVVAGPSSPAQGTKTGARGLKPPTLKQLARMHQENEGPAYQKARERFIESRYLAGTSPLSPDAAARYRAAAATKAGRAHHVSGVRTSSSAVRGAAAAPAAWSSLGPQPVVQPGRTTGNLQLVSGRISTLAVSSTGRIYAGGAQGGLWVYNPDNQHWASLTDSLPTLSVGAVALAPHHENVIYLATGEGDLSGDSYTGDGVWKSTNSGATWTHISGTKFVGATISRLVVDPHNANKLYVATIRGRGGIRRVTPPTNQTWGIYRSVTGGKYWQLLKGTRNANNGATDLELDPNRPGVLYASFWNDAVYKSNANGTRWTNISNNLSSNHPMDFSATRFAIATADIGAGKTRVYLGFDWYNADNGVHRASRIFRSDNGGATFSQMPFGSGVASDPDSMLNYCDIQCTYDNVVEVDPNDPDTLYVAGEYDYPIELGGIYRSTDGGQTWKTLGVDLHPDFHALAFQPTNSNHIVIGNDGGVWDSANKGGRLADGDDLDKVDWNDLNDGLSIAQFDSIDYANAAQGNGDVFWGGTQDNGTQVNAFGTSDWYDVSSGDGGQVVVDHADDRFVFGTYYNLTGVYRFTDAPSYNGFFIMNGIATGDRSEFYIPMLQNQGNRNQMFLGTQRVYRSDNAETDNPADVRWTPTSGDLTSGCAGSAANGGRACVISAIGISDGSTGGYAGTEEGWVWHADDATTSSGNSHWVRSDPGASVLPQRPVTNFAVDRSNWKTAWVSFAGYNAATPGHSGHVFKTTDGGQTWTNVTGNLPDNPVNSLQLDPSDAQTVFAGTDVGSFVTHNGGASWDALGTGLPRAAVWQQAYDPSRGLLVAGTHGRGGWTIDTGIRAPALVASMSADDKPAGAGTSIPYTITVHNIGSMPATTTITDTIPAHTQDAVAGDGGVVSEDGTTATWSGIVLAPGESQQVHLTVTIDPDLPADVTQIVNDGLHVTSTEGPSTTGSPFVTPIAPPHAVVVAPKQQTQGGDLGAAVSYPFTVTNRGYLPDSYTVSADSGWSTSLFESDCTTPVSTTSEVDRGASVTLCAQVTVPNDAAAGSRNTATLTAKSVADATVTDTAELVTVPAASDTLVVDQDGSRPGGGAPDAQAAYVDALTAAGHAPDVWDVTQDGTLSQEFLNAHPNVYWETGISYPDPLAPYEAKLQAFLDAGNSLFVSGQDILDQEAGTADFVKNYLHITWDGSPTQNDKPTVDVNGIDGTPIGDQLGSLPLNQPAEYDQFEDEITPNNGAEAQFKDDSAEPNALAVTDSTTGLHTFKVVFFAFPFENMGTADDRAEVMTRVASYLGR